MLKNEIPKNKQKTQIFLMYKKLRITKNTKF